jgi:hypothetical protein
VVAAGPVVAGWLLQVIPVSVQLDATCSAWSVWPSFADAASRRSRAEATVVHPGGRAGSGKRTSARELLPPCDFTFSVESLPKLFEGLPWLTQLSRSAERSCGVFGQTPVRGGASGSSKTRTSSGGRSMPFSLLWKACAPLPFSVASRIRKPWLPNVYMSRV